MQISRNYTPVSITIDSIEEEDILYDIMVTINNQPFDDECEHYNNMFKVSSEVANILDKEGEFKPYNVILTNETEMTAFQDILVNYIEIPINMIELEYDEAEAFLIAKSFCIQLLKSLETF